MPTQSSIKLYKAVAILSFVILACVQFFLVYNTYKLKDEQHYFEEKESINTLYRQTIANDKVSPGGQAIIDKHIVGNMELLQQLYHSDKQKFQQQADAICDSIFAELRENNSIDSLMESYKSIIQYEGSLKWLSLIEAISITFNGSTYIPLFKLEDISKKGLLKQNNRGKIAGTLTTPDKQNLSSSITVSSPSAFSNRITFSLYVDSPYRTLLVFKKMLPTFLLALISIFCVATIFYITFRNWVKQKKLAEMKSDFVNSITHEFHTPLSSIIVANKSIQNEKVIDDKNKILSLTAVIGRQSQRLKSLFSQVLDLTLLNASSLNREDVPFEQFVEEVILDFKLQLQQDTIFIDYDKVATNTIVPLDKFWVATMIINLLDNGIKYNNSSVKRLRVFIRKKDRQLNLHIEDNGIGVPLAIRKAIFDKFYRNTKNMDTNAVNGLGLGLFYVQQCVTAHGWELSIDSQEKEGSTFIVHIPMP